ncbi:hypothetical protein NRIC_16910 [Enterococcus florum]|uniref:Uncharacterized protein n=1 Tax=Enterococcus florum TaxID=2480627 RepID=A0A4P5P7K9_9ENTE|nr:hypothetical protein [Enterococcus florum]GCF93800.1 hypothetical protein NRIC_16910 [Enterococcus florum]
MKQRVMNIKNNAFQHKKIIIPVVVLLLCLAGFLWWNNQWVMRVNGQKISKEEYVFYQKVYPQLEKKELQEQIVEDKVQLEQAKKAGFEVVDSYQAVVKQMEKTNQKNQKKIKKKQVVYGLREYDEATYYAYTLSNSISDLKKSCQQEVTDKDVKTFYKDYPEAFREVENKELYRVCGDEKQLKELIAVKGTTDQLEGDKGIKLEKVQLKESTMRDWLKYYDEEIQEIVQLKAQTWSSVYGEGKNARSYYCISTNKGPIQPLEAVSETIRIQLEKENYQKHLEKWVDAAKVEHRQ